MLADNPLLTLLGRRGRGAVVEALRGTPARAWNVRDLARAAGVPVMTAARAVEELAALGVIDTFRPGRDKVVRWQAEAEASRLLARFEAPDLRAEGIASFVDSFVAALSGRRLLRWHMPGDRDADPLCPTRIAVLAPDEDVALEAVGVGLDAVTAAGWPRPEVTVFDRAELDPEDPVAAAVLAGEPLN